MWPLQGVCNRTLGPQAPTTPLCGTPPTCICVSVCVYKYACRHTCSRTHTYVYTYVCIYKHIYICPNTYCPTALLPSSAQLRVCGSCAISSVLDEGGRWKIWGSGLSQTSKKPHHIHGQSGRYLDAHFGCVSAQVHAHLRTGMLSCMRI